VDIDNVGILNKEIDVRRTVQMMVVESVRFAVGYRH